MARKAARWPYQVFVKRNPNDEYQQAVSGTWAYSASEALDDAVRGLVSSKGTRADFPYSVKVQRAWMTQHGQLLDVAEVITSQWLIKHPYDKRQALLDYMHYHTTIPSTEYERILRQQGLGTGDIAEWGIVNGKWVKS
jgi:hypothetical protein